MISSLTIFTLIALFNQCHAFQRVVYPAWGKGKIPFSGSHIAAVPTALGAVKQGGKTPSRRKGMRPVPADRPRRKRSAVSRSRRPESVARAPRRQTSALGDRYAMLEHDILTAEQEQDLGRKIRQAISLKEKMINLSERRFHQRFDRTPEDVEMDLPFNQGGFNSDDIGVDREELAGLSVYGIHEKQMQKHRRSSPQARFNLQHVTGLDHPGIGHPAEDTAVASSGPNFPHYDLLSDDDVVTELGIRGGREELTQILTDGALARDTIISSNIRLVVSIAKKWCRQGSSHSSDSNGHRSKTLYAGSWTRPSLDEAIQEGILGLAEAADRFDPERKLKFATYATYWITNSVRKCFQNAATGCLRVPPHYHMMRQRYQKFVKQCYQSNGSPPTMKAAAEELGLPEQRLQFMLRSTESLISIDAPAVSGVVPGRGGAAGAIEISSDTLILANTLACAEPGPHERVDMSLLRQCLENAMASELSPHERDVLRLRHGLDDGVSRSAREVVELCGGTLSVSDIRSAELRAFRKLRSPFSVNTVHLLSFLDHAGVDTNTISTS